jgi:DNA polymerase-3 subunit beta
VEVAIAAGKIRFAVGQVTLTSKLIDGQFPDYERVVPSANDKRVCLDPEKLAEAADRVLTVSTDKTRAVKMTVHADRLTLEVSSPENGQAVEEVDTVEAGDGEGLQLGFNGKYLLEVLGHLTASDAEVMLGGDAAAPSLWRDGPDAQSFFVLMPMRV